MMRSSPLPTCLTALVLATLLAPDGRAQSFRETERTPRRGIVVSLAAGADPDEVALETGTVIEGQIVDAGLVLLRPRLSLSGDALDTLVADIDQASYSHFAERLVPVATPGSECGPDGQFGSQQCTMGFVDGEPSSEKYEAQEWLERIGVPKTQQASQGVPHVVAVVDSGVDPDHSALAGRLAGDGWDFLRGTAGGWDLADGIDNDGDGVVDEAYGHGTHVAGTVALINPAALILPMRVVDSEGNGTSFDVAAGIWEAVAQGAQTINLSLSSYHHSQAVAESLHYALTLGVEVYTSAGNTGAPWVLFPGNLATDATTLFKVPPLYPHGVVCVTGLEALEDHWAEFSAWGPEADLSAPSVGIYGPYPDERWAWWSGTSMACAVASGTASLLESSHASTQGWAIGERLIETSVEVDGENPDQAGGLGGRVDAWAAYLSFAE